MITFAGLLLCTPRLLPAAEVAPPLVVPDGFRVELFAGDTLAHDIYCMTIDRSGQVVVAGRGYIKTLWDDDADGKADRAVDFAQGPASGGQGLLALRDGLLVTGDNGLWWYNDQDRDGIGAGKPVRWYAMKHGEHGAHGLRQGPDGAIYLVCGNMTGVDRSMIASTRSPVQDPESGVIVRMRRDGKSLSVLAHGFRNAYDIAFDRSGNLFTVDSDGERDHHLPWYVPTRLFHVGIGMHHGWVASQQNHSWSRPGYFSDSMPRLAEMGRGSPTGLETYQHTMFPERYRHGVFSCCWTMGRVYFTALATWDASFRGEVEDFVSVSGDAGLAPVDLVVAPDGALLVAVGGRGTRGGVYRISHSENADRRTAATTTLDRVLAAPQPMAAWSRAVWEPLADQLGAEAIWLAVLDSTRPADQRIRGLQVLMDRFPHACNPKRLQDLALRRASVDVAVQAIRAIDATAKSRDSVRRLTSFTADARPAVRLAAWQQLLTVTQALDTCELDWDLAARSRPRIRNAAATVAARHSLSVLCRTDQDVNCETFQLGVRQMQGSLPAEDLWRLAECIQKTNVASVQLDALRCLHLSLGGIRMRANERGDPYLPGYRANDRERVPRLIRTKVARRLAEMFPVAEESVNRELVRTVGLLGDSEFGLEARVFSHIQTLKSVPEQLHYLMAWAQIGPRDPEQVADALLRLNPAMRKAGNLPSRNWPQHVEVMFDLMQARNPLLAAAVIASPLFVDSEHASFALRMPPPQKRQAASLLFARLAGSAPDGGDGHGAPESESQTWNAQLIELWRELPDELVFPALRKAWDDPVLRPAIVASLAQKPDQLDRFRFVEALRSYDAGTVRQAAEVLGMLDADQDAVVVQDVEIGLEAWKRFADGSSKSTCQALQQLLCGWSGVEPTDAPKSADAWRARLRVRFPDMHPHAGKDDSLDAWTRRLRAISWSTGDAGRGQEAFVRRSCQACHRGNRRLGPDLKGITARLAPWDLFRHVVAPNLEVAPPYRVKQYVLRDGKIIRGVDVYRSPNGTIVQVDGLRSLRLNDHQVEQVLATDNSLMPTGLLDQATDQELADLYRYMQGF